MPAKEGLQKLWQEYASALGERAEGAQTQPIQKLSLRGERLTCALSQAEFAEGLALECAQLKLQQREARLELRALRGRGESFWARVSQLHAEATEQLCELSLARQARMREVEVECLQPLTACNAELRLTLSTQRAEHEQRCVRLRRLREEMEGDLAWRVFCHRLEHEQLGAVLLSPLPHEQVQVIDSVVLGQTQASMPKGESTCWRVVRAASLSIARGAPSDAAAAADQPASSATQPLSARATRTLGGLLCSQLCSSREELHAVLEKMVGSVLGGKEAREGGRGDGEGGKEGGGRWSNVRQLVKTANLRSDLTSKSAGGAAWCGLERLPLSTRTARAARAARIARPTCSTASQRTCDPARTGRLDRSRAAAAQVRARPLFPINMGLRSLTLSWLQPTTKPQVGIGLVCANPRRMFLGSWAEHRSG